jgi:hypothetical protein
MRVNARHAATRSSYVTIQRRASRKCWIACPAIMSLFPGISMPSSPNNHVIRYLCSTLRVSCASDARSRRQQRTLIGIIHRDFPAEAMAAPAVKICLRH